MFTKKTEYQEKTEGILSSSIILLFFAQKIQFQIIRSNYYNAIRAQL